MPRHRQHDLLPGPIRGITRTSLWRSWKAVRKELRNASIRDVVDFLDYDVNPNVWIDRLLARIASGEYEPEAPRRFTLGKSKGFSRNMTLPAVPDLVLYRTIVEHIFSRSCGRKHKNVYFLRDELSKAQKAALDDAQKRMERADDVEEEQEGNYRFTGRRSFYNWLRFDQYRKHLIYGSLAQFVGKRAVEKDAPRKSPKAGLSRSAWKSRKSRAISTFPTAPATTNHFPLSP